MLGPEFAIGDGAIDVLLPDWFVGELVAGTATSGPLRIATLDHEVRHDAMERQAVIELVARERHEVVDALRRQLGLQAQDDVSLGRGDRRLVELGGLMVSGGAAGYE